MLSCSWRTQCTGRRCLQSLCKTPRMPTNHLLTGLGTVVVPPTAIRPHVANSTARFWHTCLPTKEGNVRVLGAVRGLAQASSASGSDGIDISSSSTFEEDCRVVQECNDLINARLDIPVLKARLAQLDEMVADPTLYEDSTKANKLVTERSKVEGKLQTVGRLTAELESWIEMHEMAVVEREADMLKECTEKVALLRREAEQARAEALLALAGDFSSCSCFLELQAGAGGTESHDWTQMLLRMYTRWAEDRGLSVKTLNLSSGDEAGLRGATVLLEGDSAYGWLRTEAGVHRLVRNSPYDPTQRRHTSFSQVRIFPETDGGGPSRPCTQDWSVVGDEPLGRQMPQSDPLDRELHEIQRLRQSVGEKRECGGAATIEIPVKDLRIETMRSQGAGGQHVNTTDSAVRITHLPSGLVAASQSDRSQHRNKETAMRVLRSKLFQQQEDARRAKRNEYAQGLGDNAFGNQIRSYVMSPYQLVKDHRTGHQDGDVSGVLDGGIDAFIQTALTAEHMKGGEKQQQQQQQGQERIRRRDQSKR